MTESWKPPTIDSQMKIIHSDNVIPGALEKALGAIQSDGVYLGRLSLHDGIGDPIEPATGYISAEVRGQLVWAMPNAVRLPRDHPAMVLIRKKEVASRASRVQPSMLASNTGLGATVEARHDKSPQVELQLNGVENPNVPYKDGVKGVDLVTIGIGAREVGRIMDGNMRVPTIGARYPEVLESLTSFTLEGNTLTTQIDTGKMMWTGSAEETRFTAFDGEIKQGVQLSSGRIAEVDGNIVSRETMTLPDGREVTLWFAEVIDDLPNRYDPANLAARLMQGFETAKNAGDKKRIIPAVDIHYETELPELVAANTPLITKVTQEIKFALDYTGARASAATAYTMRGALFGNEPYVFGARRKVAYWLSEGDTSVDMPPFAVTVSQPAAWLNPDQHPVFNA